MNSFLLQEMMPFHDIPLLGDLLSLGDVLFAVVLATGMMLLFRLFRIFIHRLFARRMQARMRLLAPEDFARLLAHCRSIFPVESVTFQGETFTRGMKVRVTFGGRKAFEGEFIGLNADDIICIVARDGVATDKFNTVKALVPLSAPASSDEDAAGND